MPSLQKQRNREVRKSGEYITQSRKWIVIMLLLIIAIGIVASEMYTRGKINPYFDGGWLTFLVHSIVNSIKEFFTMLSDAVKSLRI